jgi:epoxyqueuosine reductase
LITNSPYSLTQFVKQRAAQLGFAWCGVAKAEFLANEAPRLETFLKENRHAEMGYMANHFDKRLNPTLLVDGAKSVISFAFNYHQSIDNELSVPKISQYALGEDYHIVLKEKLKQLVDELQTQVGKFSARCFVDSAPVLERAWAAKAGFGWIGKNTMMINKQMGSYFFLAEIICDIELEYDNTIAHDYCGTCNKCVESCPTQAINGDKTMDGSKCISYFTIELKKEIPTEYEGRWNDWIFGCDICQTVCPWNRFAKASTEELFKPLLPFNNMQKQDWLDITAEVFNSQLKKSPMHRGGLQKIQQNIRQVMK